MSDILMAGSTKAKKIADLMFLPPAERESGYFLDPCKTIPLDGSPAGLRQIYAALTSAHLFPDTSIRHVPDFWHKGHLVKGPKLNSNHDMDNLQLMTLRVFVDNDHLSIREASRIAVRIRNWHNGPSIMQRLAVLEMQSRKNCDRAERRDYFVDGTINGTPVDALPDTGAGACFISPKVASDLNLMPDIREKRTVRLANGTIVESPGTVDVKWRFDKQLSDIAVKCWILPGCVHDMILGKRFLDATKTLTQFKERIKSRLVDISSRLRLQRIEVEQHVSQHLCGNLNGHFTSALADTGSDAMFVSSAYARKCGFEVDRDSAAQCEVEFADGSTQWTAGVVRDALWTIGGRSIRSDFLVLDNLSEDVVLSKDYLFEQDVYTTADEYFIDFETEEDGFYDLLNIRLLGKYGKALHEADENYLNDIRSPDACRPDMLDRELLRRDLIRDHIATLPQYEQKPAYEAEDERQRLWQEARTKQASRVAHVPPMVLLPPLLHDAPPRVKVSRRLKLVQGLLGTSYARNGLQKARKGIDAVRDGAATRTATWGSKHDTVAIPLTATARAQGT